MQKQTYKINKLRQMFNEHLPQLFQAHLTILAGKWLTQISRFKIISFAFHCPDFIILVAAR